MAFSTATRRSFLATAAVGGTVVPSAFAQASSARRPNILLILPDQLRAQSVGYLGNKDVRTPHIDQLAAQGVILPYTYANTPVCCPARANILTGQYAHKNGMTANDLRLRESAVSFAELLQAAGYRTGFIGKWHLDGGPRNPGFVPPGPRRQGFAWWAANECSHAHFNNRYFRETPQAIAFDKFEPEGWTDLAVEFLQGVKKDRSPFFLTIQMGPPHDPYKAPEKYAGLYDPEKLTMRPNWQAKTGLPGPQAIAQYYAMITAVDDQVGRLLSTLDELNLSEDTIVLFTSDHGDMLGSQGRALKRKPWEESIAVPGVLRYPRRVKPGRSDAFFTHVDVAPTLLTFCGIKPPAVMQGTDLTPVLLHQTGAQAPDSAFFQIFGPFQGDGTEDGWRGVRTRRYMYARFENRPWVLYDMEKDPYQLQNLVDDPAHRAAREDMERRLSRWMTRTSDSWRYNWHVLVEDKGRLYSRETFYSVDEYLTWAKANPDAAAVQ